MKRSFIPYILAIILAIALSCTSPHGGFEVTNGMIIGKILDEDLSPAGGAAVYFIGSTYDPFSNASDIADSTFTDANGAYRFDSMPQGFYSIIARKGDRASYRDSLYINSDGVTMEITDTLEKTVICKGVVRLQNNEQDNSSAIILVLGTNVYTMAKDSDGNFTLPPLPSGTYQLRILTTNTDYPARDTVITLEAKQLSVTIDTLILTYGGIPKVGPVTAIYDERLMTTTLSWPPLDQNNSFTYHVERIEGSVPSLAKLMTRSTINTSLTSQPDQSTSDADGFRETTWVDYTIPAAGAPVSFVVSAYNAKGQWGGFSDTITTTATSKLHLVSSLHLHDMPTTGLIQELQMVQDGSIVALQNQPDGDTLFKFDSTGTLLNKFACINWSWTRSLQAGPDGNLYLFASVSGGSQLICMNTDFEVLKVQPILADTLLVNARMTSGPDGILYVYDTPSNASLVIAFTPDLTEKQRWQLDNFVLGFQVLPDSIVGYDYGASLEGNVVIRYYAPDFSPLEPVELTSGTIQYRHSRPTTSEESKFFRGDNGLSVLYYSAYFQGFNDYAEPYDVLFFNPDHTLKARARLKGAVVKITSDSDIYWFTDNVLYRYRLATD